MNAEVFAKVNWGNFSEFQHFDVTLALENGANSCPFTTSLLCRIGDSSLLYSKYDKVFSSRTSSSHVASQTRLTTLRQLLTYYFNRIPDQKKKKKSFIV